LPRRHKCGARVGGHPIGEFIFGRAFLLDPADRSPRCESLPRRYPSFQRLHSPAGSGLLRAAGHAPRRRARNIEVAVPVQGDRLDEVIGADPNWVTQRSSSQGSNLATKTSAPPLLVFGTSCPAASIAHGLCRPRRRCRGIRDEALGVIDLGRAELLYELGWNRCRSGEGDPASRTKRTTTAVTARRRFSWLPSEGFPLLVPERLCGGCDEKGDREMMGVRAGCRGQPRFRDSDPEGARLAWQPCSLSRLSGRRPALCVPSFRTVCPFQARLSLHRQIGLKL